ncbi:MAG: Cytochrome-c peroxidase [Pedosphaera sp.]|nr:Cytochrome-c peroxidase [Pedosphaera sp.]
MNIAPAGAQPNATVTLTDPGNHVWVLQTSTNFVTWTETDVWKVFNGNYHLGISPLPTAPNFFYRAIFDPTRQNVPSTVSNALHLPVSPYSYAAPALPPNFLVPPISTQDNTPATNPVTDAGATLGRVLFYDKRLSTNQTIACSSCHQAKYGFSDPRRFSVGYDGSVGTRNAMGLNNDRYYQRGHFFWDERAATLEDQVLQPIQNPIEMGMTLPTLLTRLSAEPFYTDLFNRAFGTPDVTTNRISLALAQFVRSIISTNSKYDQGIPVGFTNFTAQEKLGRQIFLGQVGVATCAACHGTDNFVPPNIFNNGLEFPYVDKGVGGITGRAQDMGLFKVPSLRNIGLTAPYMHDGRFATLEEVVEFYNSGIVDNPNLSPPLRTPPRPGQPPGGPLRLNLTPDQKAALVAFLKTLTDTNVTSDVKFSDPFNYGN